MSQLFTPIRLGELDIRNRVWVSPMCQYSAEDGMPDSWHLVHLGSFARGGAGLVFTEASAVVPEGRISPQDTGIWNDEQQQAWASIVEFIYGQGARAGIQLAHAGRKASTRAPWKGRGAVPDEAGGWQPVAPSALPFPGLRQDPRELTGDEIGGLVEAFGAAAARAMAAGFDVIEVHAAHGYLLHQFLSPLSNRREGEDGGSFGDRGRGRVGRRLRDPRAGAARRGRRHPRPCPRRHPRRRPHLRDRLGGRRLDDRGLGAAGVAAR